MNKETQQQQKYHSLLLEKRVVAVELSVVLTEVMVAVMTMKIPTMMKEPMVNEYLDC